MCVDALVLVQAGPSLQYHSHAPGGALGELQRGRNNEKRGGVGGERPALPTKNLVEKRIRVVSRHPLAAFGPCQETPKHHQRRVENVSRVGKPRLHDTFHSRHVCNEAAQPYSYDDADVCGGVPEKAMLEDGDSGGSRKVDVYGLTHDNHQVPRTPNNSHDVHLLSRGIRASIRGVEGRAIGSGEVLVVVVEQVVRSHSISRKCAEVDEITATGQDHTGLTVRIKHELERGELFALQISGRNLHNRSFGLLISEGRGREKLGQEIHT